MTSSAMAGIWRTKRGHATAGRPHAPASREIMTRCGVHRRTRQFCYSDAMVAGPTTASRSPFKGATITVDSLRDALSRRAELMRRKPPADIHGPQPRLLWGELASPLEPLRRLFREPLVLPRAENPQVVMLLPGFGTHPLRMRYMAQRLERAGHKV